MAGTVGFEPTILISKTSALGQTRRCPNKTKICGKVFNEVITCQPRRYDCGLTCRTQPQLSYVLKLVKEYTAHTRESNPLSFCPLAVFPPTMLFQPLLDRLSYHLSHCCEAQHISLGRFPSTHCTNHCLSIWLCHLESNQALY